MEKVTTTAKTQHNVKWYVPKDDLCEPVLFSSFSINWRLKEVINKSTHERINPTTSSMVCCARVVCAKM